MAKSFNEFIREATGRGTKETEKAVLRRADFASDEAFLAARTDEILQVADPAREAALRQAKAELAEQREAELRDAVSKQRATLKENAVLSAAAEEEIRNTARARAEREFYAGKISFDSIAGRATEIAGDLAEQAIERAVNGQIVGQLFRGEIALESDVEAGE